MMRLEYDSKVNNALRGIAEKHSLCTPFSRVGKYWRLAFDIDGTRATLSGEAGERITQKLERRPKPDGGG
jgi:hypothetical protein